MNKHASQLVFFDVEGTLTGVNGRGHDSRLMAIFSRLKALSVRLGLCTGRDSLYAKAIHRIFDLNGPVIAENGCELIPEYSHFETETINMGGFSEEERSMLMENLSAEGILSSMYSDPHKKYMITLYPRGFPHFLPGVLTSSYREVLRVLAGREDVSITCSSAAVDIFPRGVDKGEAIQNYCSLAGVPLKSVLYIGDSWNDLSAFDRVGSMGGLVGFVGQDTALLEKIQKYHHFHSQASGSSGVVEILNQVYQL